MITRTRSRLSETAQCSWAGSYYLTQYSWDVGNVPVVTVHGVIPAVGGSAYAQGLISEIGDDPTPGYGDKECEHIKVWFKSLASMNVVYNAFPANGHMVAVWPGRDLQWAHVLAPRTNPWRYFNRTAEDKDCIVRMVFPPADDEEMVNSLYARTAQPRVDLLLNLAEADEIPNALATLARAPSALRLKSLWDGDGIGVRRLAKATELSRKLIIDLVLADVEGRSVNRRLLTRTLQVFAREGKPIIRKALPSAGKLSGMYLAYEFGLAPIVSDMQKLVKYMDRVEADKRRFDENRPRNCSIKHPGYVVQGSNYPTSTPVEFGAKASWRVGSASCERCYHLAYRENSPYKTSLFRNLDFLLRRFTSGGMASFLWQRVPFSFVVDWFLDLGPIVRGFDAALGCPGVEVFSLTKSVKGEAKYDRFVKSYAGKYDGELYAIVDSHDMEFTTSYYHRWPLTRRAVPTVSSGNFGKKRVALSSALVTQRFVSRRSR